MRCLIWLLFLPGFLCYCVQGPVEVPKSLIAWTGACLSIPCRYQSCLLNPIRTNKLIINSLAWYLNPVFDPEKKDFSGTVLYKPSADISPAFAGRVRFLGDLERDCSLQLSDLRASENGSYGLRLITSKPGKQQEEKWMTEISVNVMDAPKDAHVELVTGSQIQEGTTVVLSCSCRAHPPVSSYTWYRNGQHIPAQTQQELRFDRIHADQSGSYHCEPQNRVGMSESPAITVDVQEVQITLKTPQRIREGDAVTLKCSVGNSNPPVTKYTWYKDNSQYQETQESVLTFPATEERSGNHSCAAQNAIGYRRSPPVSVAMQCDVVTLKCSVGSSNPPVTKYTWYKDNSQDQETQESVLTFPATEQRSGNRSCAAQNAIGYRRSPPVAVAMQWPCGDCYQIQTPIIVGVVIGDLVFTLLLIAGVYHCTKRCSKPTGNSEDQKVYMNMPGRVN
ncbi:cysteine proteinase precursor [Platysternon megacephalum]|uniref:B-cell receptor CD22 n=1 Tax=Platysternon megacephalum TaxID=55544 RepID=A0A4D9DN42_9SAUR|nr:cysteine proteinase precursor [Platysternon megacephalum]